MNTFVPVWKFNYYDNIINEIEDNNSIHTSRIEKQIENENSEANNDIFYRFIHKKKYYYF